MSRLCCVSVCVSVSVCLLRVCPLSRVYVMLLDGKVSHVAANIVTIVSVRVHASGNSSDTNSDKY